MQLPVSTRKRKADDAPETELVTLRNIIKRLYNTARTNFFTSIIKAFRQAAGAPTATQHSCTMPACCVVCYWPLCTTLPLHSLTGWTADF